MDWQAPSLIAQQRTELENAIEKWRKNWESRNISQYAENYSQSFTAGNRNYKSWMARKETINRGKTRIKIQLTNISIFSDPGEKGLIIVRFNQRYNSNNYNGDIDKRQYWKQEEGGVWRIIYEGAATSKKPVLANNQ